MRLEVASTSGSGKTVENSGAQTGTGRTVQVDAINLDVAIQRGVDGVVERVTADRVLAVRENDENSLSVGIAMPR